MPPQVAAAVRVVRVAKKAAGAASQGKKTAAVTRDSSRGIQNAVSRFTKQREGQLLQNQLLGDGPTKRKEDGGAEKGARGRNKSRYKKRFSRNENPAQDQAILFEEELKKLSDEGGFEYTQDDVQEFIANPPQKPVFPTTMLLVGVIKDIIDLSDFTGIGVIITTIISFVVYLVLFIYYLGKMNGVQRWLWKRWVFAGIISLIPFLKGILPETTLLVFLAYHHENKVVAGITRALETLSSKAGSR